MNINSKIFNPSPPTQQPQEIEEKQKLNPGRYLHETNLKHFLKENETVNFWQILLILCYHNWYMLEPGRIYKPQL